METMQVFWEFLRADKREASLALKGVQGTQMDTAETELFMNIRSDLQKVCHLYSQKSFFQFLNSILHNLILCAEGEEAERCTKKWQLHSEKVPKTSRRSIKPSVIHVAGGTKTGIKSTKFTKIKERLLSLVPEEIK